MKTSKRKILSLLLVPIMVFSLLPAQVFAMDGPAAIGTTAPDVYDFDEDDNALELVAMQTLPVTVTSAHVINVIKMSKGPRDAGFETDNDTHVTAGEMFQYQLYVRNDSPDPMTDLVMIDIFPYLGDTYGSEWRPLLNAPIIPPPGVDVKYSLSDDPIMAPIEPGGTGSWLDTPPADISTVRSIRLDFGSHVFAPDEFATLIIDMIGTADAPIDTTCFNSVQYIASAIVGGNHEPYLPAYSPPADARVTMTFDTTAPTVSTVAPSGSSVPVSGNIVVTFSGAMNTAAGTVTLDKGGTVNAIGAWSNGDTVYTIGYSSLNYSTGYTINISGFQDVKGNPINPDPDATHTFTTRARPQPSGGGGDDIPPDPVIKIDGVDLTYKKDADGNVTVNPTEKQIQDVIKNMPGDTVVFDFSGISGIKSLVFEIDPAWFDSAGKSVTFCFDGYSMTIPDGMFHLMYELTKGKVSFSVKTGSVAVSISQDGKEIDWYNYEHPVTVNVPAASGSVMVDQSTGAVIPRSWYQDGAIFAKVYKIGTYEAKAVTTQSFTDTAGLWIDKATSYMAARGVVTGVGDNLFSPGTNVTRGQFITMLVRLVNIEPQGNWMVQQFSDAEAGAYYYDALLRAKALGLVSGIGENRFVPDAEITRQDMFAMLYRAMEKLGMITPSEGGMALLTFVQEELVSGKPGNLLDPQGTATRAEAAQVLYNVLVKDAE